MRVLVTGGAGFVGANLVPHLAAAGHEVVALDDLSAGARPAWWGKRSPARCVEARIEDDAAVRRAMKGLDALVHLAARPGVADSVARPDLDFATNVQGTFNLVASARANGVGRMIFASSGAVLAGAKPPLREDMAPAPIAPYGASKLYGEGITAAAAAFGIVGVSLRFSNLYGPESAHKRSVIAAFIRAALNGEPFVVYGSGRQTRDFIHVEDICRAVVKALAVKAGGVYHLGTGVETSVAQLARKVARACGIEVRIDRQPPRTGDAVRNFVLNDAARRALGWRPAVDLDEGLARTVEWTRSLGAPAPR